MEHGTAKAVVELMLRHSRELDASLRDVQATESKEVFDRYRSVVGKLMGEMLLEVLNPIFAEHPDLKPPELL